MPIHKRIIWPLFLPWGAQIEIEYNPRQSSIRTIVRQVETLGYWVSVRPYQGQQEIINQGFTSQCIGQVHIDSVDVEVTEDLFEIDGSRLSLVFEDPSSDLYGLTAIQYQGEIFLWLQREYRLHVQVKYTLYEDYLVAQNQRQNIYPKYTARLSDLLLLNRVIKSIVHNDAWYLPEKPDFEYGCLINIRGSILYFTIPV